MEVNISNFIFLLLFKEIFNEGSGNICVTVYKMYPAYIRCIMLFSSIIAFQKGKILSQLW